MKSKIFQGFILSLITVFVCLFFAEIALRIIDYPKQYLGSYNEEGSLIYLRSPEFHHDYKHSQNFYRHPFDFSEMPVINHINSLGIRGPEIASKGNKKRVLILGDSFVEADEIPYDSTFSELLNLNNNTHQYIPKGISSWSPILELNWYNKIGRSLDPDIIIVALCINDFYDSTSEWSDVSYAKTCLFDKDNLPVTFNIHETKAVNAPWYNNIKIARLYRNTILKINAPPQLISQKNNTENKIQQYGNSKQIDYYLTSANDEEYQNFLQKLLPNINEDRIKTEVSNFLTLHRDTVHWNIQTKANINEVFKQLSKLKDMLTNTNSNSKLIVTYIPLGINFDAAETDYSGWGVGESVINTDQFNNYLLEKSKLYSIEYADLYSYFKSYKLAHNDHLYLHNDGHLNLNGHRLFANFIKTVIQ